MARIGILDDDKPFVRLVAALVRRAGHEPVEFPSAGRLLDAFTRVPPDLLVLEETLPGMDGIELVRLLRRAGKEPRPPIILVCAAAPNLDRLVRGFDEGADEYLAKPLDRELFVVRLQSLLRSGSGPPPAERIQIGVLALDLEERQAFVSGSPAGLRNLEFDLLLYFARNANRMVTRRLLLASVWKQPDATETRTVDKHVENLRRKLGPVGACVETVVGAGYVFRPPPGKPPRKAGSRPGRGPARLPRSL